MNEIYIILIAYILIIIGISIYDKNKSKSINNFALGNRKANGFMSALSYGSANFSSVMFIGYAGSLGWQYGIFAIIIGITNALIGTTLAWLVLAKKTKEQTVKYKAKTLPELLSNKFKSKGIKYLSAVIIFIFLLPYSSSVYLGLTSISATVLNIDVEICMIIIALLTSFIVLAGGYKTTLKADAFQGVLIFIGVISLLFIVINSNFFGGFTNGFTSLINETQKLNLNSNQIINLIAIILITSLGPWGLPQMTSKYYAIKDDKEIKKGTIVSSIFALIVASIGYFVGSTSIVLYNSLNQIPGVGMGNTDYLVPNIILSTNASEYFYGFILVLLIAASVTTLSSLTITASTTISVDLVDDVLEKKENNINRTKIICLLFILFSFIIATSNTPILIMMSYSWGILSASFIAVYVLTLYYKKLNKIGIYSGIITGLIISIIPLLFRVLSVDLTIFSLGKISDNGNVFSIIGIILSFAACFIGSNIKKLSN